MTSRKDLGSCTCSQLGRSTRGSAAGEVPDSVTKRGNWKLSPFEESSSREGRSGWEARQRPTAHHEGAEGVELALQRVAIELDGGQTGEVYSAARPAAYSRGWCSCCAGRCACRGRFPGGWAGLRLSADQERDSERRRSSWRN